MLPQDAIKIADKMRADFSPRQSTIDKCRRYGYQMRENGEPAWENSKLDPLEPLQTSFPASCAWRLALYLHANTIGVGSTFFELKPFSIKKDKTPSQITIDALSKASDKVMRRLMDTNFSAACASAFNDVAVVGTAITYCEFDENNKSFRFKNFRVGDGTYYAQDSKGNPDQFCRFYKLSAKQAIQEFGDNCPEIIKKAIGNIQESSREFSFVWLVYPRQVFGETTCEGKFIDKSKKKYGSIVVELESNTIVQEGGFDSFPFAVLCWQQKDGKPYGWSPIEMSMPDIIYMSELKDQIKESVLKQVTPPLAAPSTFQGISLKAGAINYVDSNQDLANKIVPLPVPENISLMSEAIVDCQQNIKLNLMLDAFEALNAETKYMTATEVKGRTSQAVRAIAPIVISVHNNYFSPLIKMALDTMVKNNEIEIPNKTDLDGIEVKYVSVIDSMLLQGQANQMLEFVSSIMNVVQAWAGLGDYINCFVDVGEVIRQFAEKYHVPAGTLYSKEEAQAKLDAFNQAQAQAQQAQINAAYIKPIDPQKAPQEGSVASRNGKNFYS